MNFILFLLLVFQLPFHLIFNVITVAQKPFLCALSLLQFRALAPMYYRGSAAAIIVYDITKEVN